MAWLKRIGFYAIVMSLVLVMTLQFVFPAPARSRGASFVVMEWNIRGCLLDLTWSFRWLPVSLAILREQPDIVALQECWVPPQVLTFWGYNVVGPDYGQKGGTPIYFNPNRFDLLGEKEIAIAGDHTLGTDSATIYENSRYVVRGHFLDEVTDEEVFVYNLHLESSSEEDRHSGLAAIASDVQSLPEGAHVLVVGDFNLEEGDTALSQFVHNLGLVDTYREVHPDGDGYTLNGFGKVRERRIDFTYSRGDVKVISAEIREYKNPPSDHNPVVTEVELK